MLHSVPGNSLTSLPRRKVRLCADVRFARLATPHEVPPRLRATPRLRGASARSAGRRYERDVLQYLESEVFLRPEFRLLSRPWLLYEHANETHFAQPDAVLFRTAANRAVPFAIIEVKLTHTADAYWQLFSQYAPLVRLAYGMAAEQPLRLIEVTKSYNATNGWPVTHDLSLDSDAIFSDELYSETLVVQLTHPRRASL